MDNFLEQKEKLISDITNQIEKECGIKNAAWVVLLILLFINPETWTFDKSMLAKIYQAIDIIEKNEELKNLFAAKPHEESNNDKSR